MTDEALKQFGLERELQRDNLSSKNDDKKPSDFGYPLLGPQTDRSTVRDLPKQSGLASDRILDQQRGKQPNSPLDSLIKSPKKSPGRTAIGHLNLDFEDNKGEEEIGVTAAAVGKDEHVRELQKSDKFSTPKTQSRMSNYNSRPPDSSSPVPLMSPTNFDEAIAPMSPDYGTQRDLPGSTNPPLNRSESNNFHSEIQA